MKRKERGKRTWEAKATSESIIKSVSAFILLIFEE